MTGPLVLIEPYANRPGGHHHHALVALARARPGTLVIAPHGITHEATSALRGAEARVVTAPAGVLSAALMAASRFTASVSAAGHRAFRSRRWPRPVRRLPHQLTLIARCLTEAAALRTAGRLAPSADALVTLSASEALHGAAVLLGGLPHLRFIHEVTTTEDRPLRLLGRFARAGETKTLALYPTAAVFEESAVRFPRLPGQVRTFAVDDGERVTEAERNGGRTAFAIPPNQRTVCLVGGWWPHKDMATVTTALDRLRRPLHVLVAGHPLDEAVLERWRQMPQVHVHTVPGAVGTKVLRLIYAAADTALVARHPGVCKESGLLMDTARYGTPLIVSDHDPDLTARLRDQPWARVFTAGDPADLADALHRTMQEPLARPGPEASRLLGMLPADQQADFLTEAFTRLRNKEAQCRVRPRP
jgi:hypothetical protein